MTLRRRLALRYLGAVVVCLLLLAGLAYHEFVTEPRLRREFGVSLSDEAEWVEWLEVFFYAMIPVVMGFGWWAMRRTLTPIDDLAKAMERIHARNLHERLPAMGSGDEVDRLTQVFNAMTSRLERSFQQVREFTLHASHELKSPLTVMCAELEMKLHDGAELSPEERDWICGQMDEAQRLTKIVDGLTLLTKADAGQVRLERSPVSLGELVNESFSDAQVLGDAKSVEVLLAGCQDISVTGDRDRLRQLLLHLADNAVKFCRAGGTVTMSLRRVEDAAQFEIVNTGDGVPAQVAGRVFERFFRGENASASGVEGSGLGLSIAQWIVHAHGGTIRFSSVPGEYTTVVVRFPLAEAGAAPEMKS